jgi:DNA polymerase III delta prime subunit
MKRLLSTLCLVFALTTVSNANADSYFTPGKGLAQIQQITKTMQELADKYALTDNQREQIRYILLENLPAAINILQKAQSNRMDLLALTAGQVEIDPEQVGAIAQEQGALVADLIIWKEQLKAQLRAVLDEDQLKIVQEFAQMYITQNGLIGKKAAARKPATLEMEDLDS